MSNCTVFSPRTYEMRVITTWSSARSTTIRAESGGGLGPNALASRSRTQVPTKSGRSAFWALAGAGFARTHRMQAGRMTRRARRSNSWVGRSDYRKMDTRRQRWGCLRLRFIVAWREAGLDSARESYPTPGGGSSALLSSLKSSTRAPVASGILSFKNARNSSPNQSLRRCHHC